MLFRSAIEVSDVKQRLTKPTLRSEHVPLELHVSR
jgi:hypothetical protein